MSLSKPFFKIRHGISYLYLTNIISASFTEEIDIFRDNEQYRVIELCEIAETLWLIRGCSDNNTSYHSFL